MSCALRRAVKQLDRVRREHRAVLKMGVAESARELNGGASRSCASWASVS